jgi:hypothetical protein
MKRLRRQFNFQSDEEVKDASFLAPYYRRYNAIREEMVSMPKVSIADNEAREKQKARRDELRRELETLWSQLQEELKNRRRSQ